MNLKLKRGFTITEIILLLVIVGIMISGILPVFLNIITINKASAYRGVAYKMADSKLEALRYGNFDDIANSSVAAADLPAGSTITVVSDSVVDGAPQTNIKKVEVRINWNFKRAEEVKLVTYIARNGIKK